MSLAAAVAAAAVASAIFVWLARSGGAGQTNTVSLMAVLGWLSGSVLSLLGFSWFRSVDSARRLDPLYVDLAWRPRRVVSLLATVGLIAGSFGALLVAESVARS